MSYKIKKRVMIIRAEAVPGVAETVTAADYNVRFEEPKFTPKIDFDTAKKIATPDYGQYEDVPGMRAGEITASFRLCPGTDINVPPNCSKAYKMGGLVEAVQGSSGVLWTDESEGDEQTYTVLMMDVTGDGTPVGEKIVLAGCVADLDIEAAGQGKIVMGQVKLTGKYSSCADLNHADMVTLATMTSPDSTPAYVFQNATAASITNTFKCSKFKLAGGRTVSPLINTADPTCIDYFTITNREPKLSINPLKQSKAAYDAMAVALAAGGETIGITMTGPTYPLLIQAINCQMLNPKEGEREGRVNWDLDFKLLRNGYEGAKVINGANVGCLFRLLQGSIE